MKNREQIRAGNALAALEKYHHFKGQKGGDPLTGFPALVIGNGLLAAIAFSKKNGGGHADICHAIAEHLSDEQIGLFRGAPATLGGLLKFLTEHESDQLRLCTAEALAYLNYLRRFAKADSDADK